MFAIENIDKSCIQWTFSIQFCSGRPLGDSWRLSFGARNLLPRSPYGTYIQQTAGCCYACCSINMTMKDSVRMSDGCNEEDGFIICSILDGKGGVTPVAEDEIKNRNGNGAVQWLHLDYSKPKAQKWLKEKSGLSEIACDALMAADTRSRVIAIDGGLLITLRAINYNPGEDPDDMVSIRMWLNTNIIISMRHRHVYAVDDIQDALSRGDGPLSTGDFLVMLSERITAMISGVASEIEEGVDDLEEQTLEQGMTELRTRLSVYRRAIILLRRYIVPQRETMIRLQSERAGWLSDNDRMHLREIAESTVRVIEDLDTARERALIVQEALNYRLSEQMNQTIYIMSAIATIFLPLSLLTGLLGINVGGIPGSDNPWAFFAVCVILVLVATVELILFKRKRIL